MIHDKAPHDLRAESKEMQTVFALDAAGANQFEIGFIDQGGGFEGVVAAREMDPGNSSKFGIDSWYQAT
jgi:hypothetical protein